MTSTGLNQPELVLPSQPRRVETVNFHPTADCILATTSFDSLVIWDLIQAKELYTFSDHEEEVQSVAWQWSGSLLATQSKGINKQLFLSPSLLDEGPSINDVTHFLRFLTPPSPCHPFYEKRLTE